MQISMLPAACAARIAATDGSANTSQSSQTLVSRMTRIIFPSSTRRGGRAAAGVVALSSRAQRRICFCLQLPRLDQPLQVARPADQHPVHEHHREGRPAGPHLEREARAPLAEVAAVLEVLAGE